MVFMFSRNILSSCRREELCLIAGGWRLGACSGAALCSAAAIAVPLEHCVQIQV